jgi:hypothetical protein
MQYCQTCGIDRDRCECQLSPETACRALHNILPDKVKDMELYNALSGVQVSYMLLMIFFAVFPAILELQGYELLVCGALCIAACLYFAGKTLQLQELKSKLL